MTHFNTKGTEKKNKNTKRIMNLKNITATTLRTQRNTVTGDKLKVTSEKNNFNKMKKRIFLLIAVFFILNSSLFIHNCFSQWVQMSSGMGNEKKIFSFAVSSINIFAGTENLQMGTGGIWFSSNNGQNWTQTTFNSNTVYSIAISGNNIFAGSNGVWLSSNNGQNWTQTTLNNKTVYSLAISGNNVFAGTNNIPSFDTGGVFLSTDSGVNWAQTTLNNITVPAIAISGNNIFAGTEYGVYISTNNGQNWTLTVLNDKYINTLATSGNNPEDSGQVIFAGTNSGVYLSTNNGQNWTQTSLNNLPVLSFATSGNIIFAGTAGSGVWLSTNNGQNWIQKNQGFIPIPNIYALLITNNYIFAGTWNYSVWRRSFSEIIGIKKISTEVPKGFELGQNYPNPFNSMTKIKFKVASDKFIKLIVYDVAGKEVARLVDERMEVGVYEVRFEAGGLPSGIYFYRMETEKFTETKKLILLK